VTEDRAPHLRLAEGHPRA